MSKILAKSKLEFSITLELDEQQARALNAITVYGTKQFLDVFYKHLGSVYLKPYEQGFQSLFNLIKSELPSKLTEVDEVRDFLKQKK